MYEEEQLDKMLSTKHEEIKNYKMQSSSDFPTISESENMFVIYKVFLFKK